MSGATYLKATARHQACGLKGEARCSATEGDTITRVRTHWSQPEDDGGREGDSGEEDGWAPVIASGDAAPVL
jgi:hypothetical protein